MEILNGTEQWCWPSNIFNPKLKVDFRSLSVICALELDYNGTLNITYGKRHFNVKIGVSENRCIGRTT